MSFTVVQQATPRLNRSELAVPGSSPEMFEKAAKSAVDVVFLDLEDAVAPDRKVQARKNVVQALNDYNVAMELQAWLINEREHVEQRSELRERVFNALNEADVDMPFETIQVRPLEVNWSNGKAPS